MVITRSKHQEALKRNPQAMATQRAVMRQHQAIIEAGGRVACGICRRWITTLYKAGQANAMSLSLDHIAPYNDNDPATWDASNLRPTHRACNQRKGRGRIAASTSTAPEWSRW